MAKVIIMQGKEIDLLFENDILIERMISERWNTMPCNMKEMLKQYVEDVHKLYGNQLNTIILYGSYARGDFRPDSDIDIMILVDLEDEEIKEKGRFLSDVTFEYNFDNDVTIMPIVKNTYHFNRWLRSYPFYYNVRKEGIELYAA